MVGKAAEQYFAQGKSWGEGGPKQCVQDILDIPRGLEAHFLAGRNPAIQVNVDATSISQAGVGVAYIQQLSLIHI